MYAKTAIFGAAAILGLAAPAAAQTPPSGLPPSTPDQIVDGAQSCLAATTKSDVDEGKLKADGWRPASVSEDGKTVETKIDLYSKDALILFVPDENNGLCLITARLENAAVLGNVAQRMEKRLGAPGTVTPDEPKTLYWFQQNHVVRLTGTGTADTPAVRVGVVYHSGDGG